MEHPYEILVLIYEGGMGHYFDDDNDGFTPAGAITWRRHTQAVPENMACVFTFSLSDAQERRTTAFAERLVELNHGLIDMEKATAVAEKIFRSVRVTSLTGKYWGYFHSKKHAALVEFNKGLQEIFDSSELAPWELDLLEYSN